MKKILGITVLLAVIAMGLVFTACPDTDVREVTFINEMKITVDLTFKGGPNIQLRAMETANSTPDRQTVTKTGEDVVLQTITFGQTLVDNSPNDYVMLAGSLVPGNDKKGKEMIGVSLAGGTLIFRPDPTQVPNLTGFKISTIEP